MTSNLVADKPKSMWAAIKKNEFERQFQLGKHYRAVGAEQNFEMIRALVAVNDLIVLGTIESKKRCKAI